MTVDGHTLYFTYDAAGTPVSVSCDGDFYYYVTNIQGDIIAIVDTAGAEVTTYSYDAWGNILSQTGSETTIGQYNPLTYRGYVYDLETDLYYLQSRYYNPETGRFINADGYVATGQGFIGNNMFAYCLNNPVNFVDYSGNSSNPFLSDIFVGLTEKTPLMKQYKHNMSGPEVAIPTGISSEESPLGMLKAIGSSLWNNFELSLGIGMGYYGETAVFDGIDVSIGMYGNTGIWTLEDGAVNFGQDVYIGAKASFAFHNIGFHEYIYKENGVDVYSESEAGFYGDKTLTIFEVSGYLVGGITLRIGFDVAQFCHDMRKVI